MHPQRLLRAVEESEIAQIGIKLNQNHKQVKTNEIKFQVQNFRCCLAFNSNSVLWATRADLVKEVWAEHNKTMAYSKLNRSTRMCWPLLP